MTESVIILIIISSIVFLLLGWLIYEAFQSNKYENPFTRESQLESAVNAVLKLETYEWDGFPSEFIEGVLYHYYERKYGESNLKEWKIKKNNIKEFHRAHLDANEKEK